MRSPRPTRPTTRGQDGGGSIAVSSAVLSGDGKTVTLNLASALAIDSAFTVTMDRIANGAGQPLGNGTAGQFRTWDNDPNGHQGLHPRRPVEHGRLRAQ